MTFKKWLKTYTADSSVKNDFIQTLLNDEYLPDCVEKITLLRYFIGCAISAERLDLFHNLYYKYYGDRIKRDIKKEENKLNEVTLKIEVDSYKALQNYIHNELNLTKPDIEMMISKMIAPVIDKKLSVGTDITNSIDRVVSASIGRMSSGHSFNWDIAIDKAIKKAIGDTITNEVTERMKNINLADLLKEK